MWWTRRVGLQEFIYSFSAGNGFDALGEHPISSTFTLYQSLSPSSSLGFLSGSDSVTNYQPCVRELMNVCIPARSWGSTKLQYNESHMTCELPIGS